MNPIVETILADIRSRRPSLAGQLVGYRQTNNAGADVWVDAFPHSVISARRLRAARQITTVTARFGGYFCLFAQPLAGGDLRRVG